MHIGFTGTRHGMNARQHQQLSCLLAALKEDALSPGKVPRGDQDVFHHGDCEGSDTEAHAIAIGLGYLIQIHPPDITRFRAWCGGKPVQSARIIEHAPLPYLARNRAIVDASDLLIATPHTMREGLRSGTWATVRYARTHHRTVVTLWPEPRQ